MTGHGISLVTLGAADLARSSRCYQGLGWQASADGNEQVVFLKGRNLALGLHGRQAFAEDARVEERPTGFAPSPWPATAPRGKKSDRLLFAAALAGGGQATKVAQEVFWGGYSEYVADPDGLLWEVAHKPF